MATTITKLGTDTSQAYTSTTVWSFSFSHTLVAGSNRLIIVDCGGETTLADTSPIWSVTSITYGGVAMTQAIRTATTETASGYSNNTSEIWYLLESSLPTTGAKTVQINGTGPNSSIEVWGVCTQYGGVEQTAPYATNGVFVNAVAPSDTITNTITPPRDSLVRSAYVCGNVGTWTVNNSQVEILDAAQTTTSYGSAEKVGALGTETTFSSTYATGANRLTRACAIWRSLPWKINTVSRWNTQKVSTSVQETTIEKINTYDT
jgi:hypothetical protein